jgi:hypothetical protein
VPRKNKKGINEEMRIAVFLGDVMMRVGAGEPELLYIESVFFGEPNIHRT